MKCNLIVLRPNSKVQETREVEFKHGIPVYPELSDLLDTEFARLGIGDDWEHVTVLYKGRRCDMFVAEGSAHDGSPRNEAATEIYRTAWMDRHPDADPEDLPAAYGVAVLFDKQVWF